MISFGKEFCKSNFSSFYSSPNNVLSQLLIVTLYSVHMFPNTKLQLLISNFELELILFDLVTYQFTEPWLKLRLHCAISTFEGKKDRLHLGHCTYLYISSCVKLDSCRFNFQTLLAAGIVVLPETEGGLEVKGIGDALCWQPPIWCMPLCIDKEFCLLVRPPPLDCSLRQYKESAIDMESSQIVTWNHIRLFRYSVLNLDINNGKNGNFENLESTKRFGARSTKVYTFLYLAPFVRWDLLKITFRWPFYISLCKYKCHERQARDFLQQMFKKGWPTQSVEIRRFFNLKSFKIKILKICKNCNVLQSPKLFSRKIWMTENIFNFHVVFQFSDRISVSSLLT